MRIKRLFIGLAVLLAIFGPITARAQLSKSAMIAQMTACLPTQLTGSITPAGLLTCLVSVINSYQQYIAVNPQVGTNYTIQASDYGQLVTFTNSGAVAVTIPSASSFTPFNVYLSNLGTGTVTVTPSAGTINEAATLILTTGQGGYLVSDGTNWQVTQNSGSFTNPTITGTLTLPDGSIWNSTGLAGKFISASPFQLNGLEAPQYPGGRLSLTSSLPVMIADVTGTQAETIYYLPYSSQMLPLWNGTHWQEYNINAAGLSMTLSSTNNPANEVFDVYAVLSGTVPTLCSMYWGGNNSRSTTIGGKSGGANASVTQLNGLWVNNAAIATSNCYNNATPVTIAQNQGLMLGSFASVLSGQSAWVCKPTSASGGAPVIAGLSNSYNRIPVACSNLDSATSQTSASSSWAGLGALDTIQWLDSLQQVSIEFDAHVVAGNGTAAGDCGSFGFSVSTLSSTTPNEFATTCAPTATLGDNYSTLSSHEGFYPALGLNEAWAQKQSATGTTTYMPTAHQEDFTINFAY